MNKLGMKKAAIDLCLQAREKAICRKTKVGATLYSNDIIFEGHNVENRCHKGYHAEEMAIMNAQQTNVDPKSFIGIIVSFSDNDIDKLTFMCGHCRQYVWEYTLNPLLLVTEVDLKGNIVKEEFLEDLYPYPYPRADKASLK
jgi:cytidine deaminase